MQAAGRYPTIDDQFAVLAHLLPGGFGGLHQGAMYLVFPQRGADARGVASTLERCAGRQVSYLAAVRQARVLPGDFDWLQLATWRSRLDEDPGLRFVFTDTDEATNRVVVGVSSEADRRSVLNRLPTHRIPDRAVTVLVVPHPPPGAAGVPD